MHLLLHRHIYRIINRSSRARPADLAGIAEDEDMKGIVEAIKVKPDLF
jgi:hypothetical protein